MSTNETAKVENPENPGGFVPASAKDVKESLAKKNTVTIERSKLETILSRLERLESAASKAGLHKYDEAHKEETGSKVGVKVYDGKRIVSYVMTKNICEKLPSGAWFEDQQIELTFEDETKETIAYKQFATRYTLEQVDVISKTQMIQSEDKAIYGGSLFTLETSAGKRLEIGEKFLNG